MKKSKNHPRSIESTLYSREKTMEFFRPELMVEAEIKKDKPLSETGEENCYAILFGRSPKWFFT